MSKTVKAKGQTRAPVDLVAFFAGVDDVRRHLDRHRQDPSIQRDRLARLVPQLMRPRSSDDLVKWLVAELTAALGVGGAALLMRQGLHGPARGWTVRCALGHVPEAAWLLEAEAFGLTFAAGAGESAGDARPHRIADGVAVPLIGTTGLVGLLCFATLQPLDEAVQVLLQAVADTASVALEQHVLLLAP